ncbi:MAG: tetratricopeptide repeat protein [Acidobacteria bacterium]|uniref:Tetratricopeptide repeat protein n=1 Tax=Candidatus Polarisedimenticola svalbardensis TaxID=2886004 RepID=A0A8J7C2S6_9BACT|nr:tetratricopeptide repeat protein [Candidatus Polarisedimenticola svalbardensis]
MRISRFILLACLIVPTFAVAEPPEEPPSVPPLEYVRLMRQARIAEDLEQPEAALLILREALSLYPEEITVLTAMMSFHRRNNVSDEDTLKWRQMLLERLSNREKTLPPGTLGFLARNPDASEEESTEILDALRKRTAGVDPDPMILRHIAVLETRLELLEEARVTLGRLLQIDPSRALRMDCLSLDMHLEQWDGAAATMKTILETDDTPYYRGVYIYLLGKMGNYDEILRQTEIMESGEPGDLKVIRGWLDRLLLRVAWDLRDAGKDAEAGELFRRILAGNPGHREARTTLLHLYSSEEEKSTRQEQLNVRWENETNYSMLLGEGVNRVAAGDYEGGYDLLERAAARKPREEAVWYNLGLAAMQLKRWETAERAFVNASRLNRSRMESVLYYGAALQELGRFEEAIVQLNNVQEMNPDTDIPEVHFYLYRCYRGLQNAQAAARELTLYNESRRE